MKMQIKCRWTEWVAGLFDKYRYYNDVYGKY